MERFAGQIASQGYVVGQRKLPVALSQLSFTISLACPSIYHEFEGPEAIPYDAEGLVYFAYVFHILTII